MYVCMYVCMYVTYGHRYYERLIGTRMRQDFEHRGVNQPLGNPCV